MSNRTERSDRISRLIEAEFRVHTRNGDPMSVEFGTKLLTWTMTTDAGRAVYRRLIAEFPK